jgi:predicted DNA-binding transcriptional regulator AlpA
MQNQKTLTINDIMEFFQLSRVTVYRRLRIGREGGDSGLPIPLPMGANRSHRWNAEDVRQFLESANDAPKTPPALDFESEKSRQKRHAEAMKKLGKFGIKAPKKEQE